MSARILLASASARRRDILEALGLEFTMQSADVDETPRCGEAVEALVLRLAAAKATAVDAADTDIAIGADTEVVLDGRPFGKPRDEDDAVQMLGSLSGRTHHVMTGVAVARAGRVETALSVTEVTFRDIDPDEARDYWHTGEPRGKAGAYAIQGRGGLFVESIAGSYSGVVGLPVFETADLLRRFGVDVLARADE